FEVDGDDRVAEIPAQLRHRDVPRVHRVGIERRAVAEQHHQSRVVRPRRSDDVLPHLEIDDAVEIGEAFQLRAMVRLLRGRGVLLVFEAHQVSNHRHSSSPSMSSSPASTTTLWISTRNHSRNFFRSRSPGQRDSSSVHDSSWSSKSQDALSSTHSWMSSSSSNSGSRITVPYGCVRATVNCPLATSASLASVHSTKGACPTRLMAVRFTTRMSVDVDELFENLDARGGAEGDEAARQDVVRVVARG